MANIGELLDKLHSLSLHTLGSFDFGGLAHQIKTMESPLEYIENDSKCKEVAKNGTYDGEMLNGKRHGKGRMTYANGDWYDGNWQNDNMSGIGEFSNEKDKWTFYGRFKDNNAVEGSWTDTSDNGHDTSDTSKQVDTNEERNIFEYKPRTESLEKKYLLPGRQVTAADVKKSAEETKKQHDDDFDKRKQAERDEYYERSK